MHAPNRAPKHRHCGHCWHLKATECEVRQIRQTGKRLPYYPLISIEIHMMNVYC